MSEYDVSVDGDRRRSAELHRETTVDGDSTRIVFADGCATVTMGGERRQAVDDAEKRSATWGETLASGSLASAATPVCG
jgi:hypothetical protein